MSVPLTRQKLKVEESDIDTNHHDHDDDTTGDINSDEKKEVKYKLELKKQLVNKDIKMKKVQNMTIVPKCWRKSDKHLKINKQTIECDMERDLLEKSEKAYLPSWKHFGDSLDDDICTITAAGANQTVASPSLQITSIDRFFNRKRGRPPKNRFVEVYKNIHQKPQAIFTSFKLEKQGSTEAAVTNTCDSNSPPNFAQISTDTSKDCINDNNYTIESSGHNPIYLSPTQAKRLSSINTVLSTHGGRNCSSPKFLKTNKACDEMSPNATIDIMLKEKEDTSSCFSGQSCDLNFSITSFNDDRVIPLQLNPYGASNKKKRGPSISLTFDAGHAFKKSKPCGTADNVTVIRAAGTFFPESCSENYKNPSNIVKENLSVYGNDVVHNLSLKDDTQSNATDGLECSTSSAFSSPVSSMTASCYSVLPQIYDVLKMQQQLFAFYHQMTLMTPSFTPLVAALRHPVAAVTDSAIPSVSCATSTDMETDFSHNKHMISNLHKQRANQDSSCEEFADCGTKAGACSVQMHKKSTKRTAHIIKTKIGKRSQNRITTALALDQNVPERQLQYGRELIPCGYLRFRFNEDCGYEKCGYRQHQSHFHCNRNDCQYSFCDKTRFVQHTARHERLDSLMGSDFQQYRQTMTCNYTHCPYAFNGTEDLNEILNNRKSSHFHCLKCTFVCADANKVVAHRRLHAKMEFIRLAGFRKVNRSENCLIQNVDDQQINNVVPSSVGVSQSTANDQTSHCPYALRHAHYHCLQCNYSVLSRPQLLAHKHREAVQQQKLARNSSLPEIQKAIEHTICSPMNEDAKTVESM